MAEERAQRRLAAIFVVDVAGSLLRDATVVTPLKTDTFGDFKFDHLDADGQKYEIEVKAYGLPATKIHVTLDRSKTVGILHLR